MTREDYFLSTNAHGSIAVSARAHETEKGIYSAATQLQSAWNKLAKGEKLDWLEEYSMEGLWHEIVHNRQKISNVGGPASRKRTILEVVTQWTARRTYPDFLHALGGQAAHSESIRKEGLGYGTWVKNFDRLLAALKTDKKQMLDEMNRIIDTVPCGSYQKELSAFLSKQSGVKKSALNKVFGWLDLDEIRFEHGLRYVEIIE